jgi:hypothetical protein
MSQGNPTLLCLAGYFKGERFLRRAHARGAKVYLLTIEKLLDKPWPRDILADVFALPNQAPREDILKAVSYLARDIAFDQIVALDDYDVETAAALREHLRIPGMGDTQARLFRDKLAMRVKARDSGVPVPPFVHPVNRAAIADFLAHTPAPWMLKPRSEASATGIAKLESAEQLWAALEQRGDARSHYVLEKYLPGDVYHVDSIVSEGEVIFAAANRCGKPPFYVAHGGGIFTTRTLERGSADESALLSLNAKILSAFGHTQGVSHTEFIKHAQDGKFYFLETSARVGGAHIAEMVEAAWGLNLWEEWADLELQGKGYRLPPLRQEYAGVALTLARQEVPDLSAYNDPEVVYRAPEKNHAGLVVRASNANRVKELLDNYQERFLRDFTAVMPATEKPHL